MNDDWFYYDTELAFDKILFTSIFQKILENDAFLQKTMNHVKKIFFLADWTELDVIKEAITGPNDTEAEVEAYIWTYKTGKWRGLCFLEDGVIVLNFMAIIKSSDFYCSSPSQSGFETEEEFQNFIVAESRYKKIKNYNRDYTLVRSLIFWKTLFHEIRHIAQYHYEAECAFEDDEKDADEYGVQMYERIEALNQTKLNIDFVRVS